MSINTGISIGVGHRKHEPIRTALANPVIGLTISQIFLRFRSRSGTLICFAIRTAKTTGWSAAYRVRIPGLVTDDTPFSHNLLYKMAGFRPL